MDSGRDRPADRAARLIWRLRSEVEAAGSQTPASAPDEPEALAPEQVSGALDPGAGQARSDPGSPASEVAAPESPDPGGHVEEVQREALATSDDVSRETTHSDADEHAPDGQAASAADRSAADPSPDDRSLPGRSSSSEPLARPVTLLTDPATLRASTALIPGTGTRVVAIANQKGGVGKTTTAVNLGAALAELNQRVLVVDLDPQGNATTGLGVNARNLALSLYDVLIHDAPLEDAVEPTAVRNLFLVPAIIDLAGAEIELVPLISRELRLRKALEPLLEDFDLVLIDCPPSLGLLTINGLAAATEVLVPIQCEYYALEGLDQLLRNVQLVRNALNPNLSLSAIVLTMFDGRTRLAEQVADDVRAHFDDLVCRTVIPRAVRLSEAPSYGQPITIFDPSSRGAIAYRDLAKEVLDVASSRAR